jgi:hypothetical protein
MPDEQTILPCPICGRDMQFPRAIQSRAGQSELQILECEKCDLRATAEDVADVLEAAAL